MSFYELVMRGMLFMNSLLAAAEHLVHPASVSHIIARNLHRGEHLGIDAPHVSTEVPASAAFSQYS
jgi:hypothetical protein